MANVTIHLTAVLTNQKAVRALAEATDLVASLADDMPWKEEVPAAVERLKYVVGHLAVVQEASLGWCGRPRGVRAWGPS